MKCTAHAVSVSGRDTFYFIFTAHRKYRAVWAQPRRRDKRSLLARRVKRRHGFFLVHTYAQKLRSKQWAVTWREGQLIPH